MPSAMNTPHPSVPPFAGFRPGETGTTRLPDAFFSDLLPFIDDLTELKLTLYCFWAVQQRLDNHFYIRRAELLASQILPLLSALPATDQATEQIEAALTKAVARGTLLTVNDDQAADEPIYFINTARGRAARSAFLAAQWKAEPGEPLITLPERPNIFRRYEAWFGPLTPLLADKLRDTELTYPFEWIEVAIQSAIERNIRHWQYVENLLKRWQTEGPPDGLVRADSPRNQDPQTAYGRFWGD